MAFVIAINSARVEDKGILNEVNWHRTERLFEDARGDGQFVALIEGITHDEASADDSPWFTDSEKPGRAITIAAENYADLAEAVAWVHETYDVFATHVQADEPSNDAEAQDWETELVRPPQTLEELTLDDFLAERVQRTTFGLARHNDGRVTIRFGTLDEDERTETIEVDVTAYVRPLLRDLAIAMVELDVHTNPEG